MSAYGANVGEKGAAAPVYQQPMAAPGMVADAPPAHNAAPAGQPREWSTGMCSCGDDVGGFCLACWCPCITYGQYKARFDSLRQTGRALPKEQNETCNTPALLYLAVHCMTSAGWVFDFITRGEIRQRYNIEGGACGDCLRSCCCIPQHHRELRIEEEQQWGAMQQTQLQQPPV
ncbi:hypothetical protein Rhopal_007330-T1 [Rhodotorula paludigena]|uniref:PLAC8 family-domain-containing protein n=1 Tax=Rhodotorula paludigena TaxID=86838 RepID=A0AAV5GXN7_9BASI|nr:hypothetical protein Rhopal_007330-T1 [Rhodotorula paludigena]